MIHQQLIHHYQKSTRFFWSSISIEPTHTDDVDMYATGVNNNYLNPAIQKSPLTKDTFQNALEGIQNFYAAHDLPWVWVVKQDLISEDLIDTKLLELIDTSSTMYFDLSNPLTAKLINNLIINENNDDLTDWGICLAKSYQAPTETTAQYFEVVNRYICAHKEADWNASNFHHFVGYLDTVPVSCLTLSIQDKKARIDDVGTIPEHQRKGYATQMIAHALQEAVKLDANFCFLEASQAGNGVYKRIGFKSIFSNLYFKLNKK